MAILPSTPEFATVGQVQTPGSELYKKEADQVEINASVHARASSSAPLELPEGFERSPDQQELADPGIEELAASDEPLELPEGVEPVKPANVPEQFTDANYVAQLKQTKALMGSFEAERLEAQKKEKLTGLMDPMGGTSLAGMAISGVWDAIFSKAEEEHFVENPDERRGVLAGVGEDASAGFWGQDIHPERGNATKNRLSFLFKPFEVATAAITAPFSEGAADNQRKRNEAKKAIMEAVNSGEPISKEVAEYLNIDSTDPEQTSRFASHPVVAAMQALDMSKAAALEKMNQPYGDPGINFGNAVMEEQVPGASSTVQKAGGLIINILTDPTTMVGGFTAKAAQLGLKRAKNLDPNASYVGLMQEGVTQLADDITRITSIKANPELLSDIGQLAKRADEGDIAALTELNVKLSQMPDVVEHLNKMDTEVLVKQNSQIDEVLGKTDEPAFVIKDTPEGEQLNLNMSTFNNDSDLDDLVMAFEKRAESDIARYGKDEAKHIELSEAAAVDLEAILGKPVKDFRPAEAIAYRQAIQTTAAQLGQLAKKADADDASALTQVAYEKTLGIFTSLSNKATDAKVQQAQLKDIYKVGEKGGVKRVREVMAILEENKSAGYTDNALRRALAEQTDPAMLAKTAASTSRLAKLPGAYMEILTNATISSLDTQATNIKSNLGTALMMPIQTFTQSLSAVARADLKMAQTHASDGLAQLSGLSEGLSDILKMSFTKSTWDSQGLPRELRKTSELARQEIKHKVSAEHLELQGPLGVLTDITGKYVRVPGAALLVADRGFKTLNYRMQLHSTAMRMGRDAAKENPSDAVQIYKTLVNNPTDDMIVKAVDVAEQNTFTAGLGNGLAGKTQQMLAKAPYTAPWFMFFKTTTNIFKRGLKDSAPGVIKQHAMDVLKPNAAGDVARARLTLGFAAPAAVVAAMDNSDIVGRLDYKDPHDRFMIDMGVPEYSIRTGTDDKGMPTYFQYGKFEPLRAVLGLAANYKQAANMFRAVDGETGQENPLAEELFKAIAAPFIQTYTDNYMVENVGGALNILEAVNTGKEATLTRELERLTGSVVFTNFASNINNKYVDGTFRYADDYVSRIKNRIFVLSQENGAQVTAWGDDRIRPRNIGVDYMSSTVSLGQSFDKFDEEIVNKGVRLEEPPKKLDAGNGILLKMSGLQRTEFGRIRGKGIPGENPNQLGGALKPQMMELMLSEDYMTKASDKERRLMLQNMWTNRSAAAKKYMMLNDPDLKAQYEEKALLLEMQSIKTRNNPAPFGDKP